jgi:hypothetical protein
MIGDTKTQSLATADATEKELSAMLISSEGLVLPGNLSGLWNH